MGPRRVTGPRRETHDNVILRDPGGLRHVPTQIAWDVSGIGEAPVHLPTTGRCHGVGHGGVWLTDALQRAQPVSGSAPDRWDSVSRWPGGTCAFLAWAGLSRPDRYPLWLPSPPWTIPQRERKSPQAKRPTCSADQGQTGEPH